MKTTHRLLGFLAASLLLAVVSGCQTWVPDSGLTMPSGWYLKHEPSYFPRSPGYPLTNELASQEDAIAKQANRVGP